MRNKEKNRIQKKIWDGMHDLGTERSFWI